MLSNHLMGSIEIHNLTPLKPITVTTLTGSVHGGGYERRRWLSPTFVVVVLRFPSSSVVADNHHGLGERLGLYVHRRRRHYLRHSIFSCGIVQKLDLSKAKASVLTSYILLCGVVYLKG
ncbi:uncharacterized protein [Rutidosis leptorrhynchoides]|uniref:uncharacterized protein isoform X1 n=1 Tax=Rutidosis leptorrhynchoides TaxID=125765 RepID=UPI003A991C12